MPRPLVAYRIHPGNASLDLEGMFAEADEIERRYGGPIDRVRYLRYLGRLLSRPAGTETPYASTVERLRPTRAISGRSSFPTHGR